MSAAVPAGQVPYLRALLTTTAVAAGYLGTVAEAADLAAATEDIDDRLRVLAELVAEVRRVIGAVR